ncbi:MAG: sulfatase-like hydrolase/transferase [Gemmataceae bacterium]
MKTVVVVLRGLQTAFLSPYGNRWIDTPNFDLLATAGTLFDWHFADRPGTTAVHHEGWLNSLREAKVSVRILRDGSRGLATIAEQAESFKDVEKMLKAARKAVRSGLEGLLWVEFAMLLPPWQIAASFLETLFPPPVQPDFAPQPEQDEDQADPTEPPTEQQDQGLEYLPDEEPLEAILSPTLGAIDPQDDRLYLSLQSTYAAAVMQADAILAELLDGLPDEVTLFVTSDEGLALGEHGYVGLNGPLHEPRVHLPLFVVGPGIPAGGRIASLTSAGDLAATLAKQFGVAWPGRDLLASGESTEAVVLSSHAERGVRTPAWFLRVPATGQPELYEKPADRLERLNLAQVHFTIVEELLTRLPHSH